jgi:hypothetical protein
MGSVGESLVDAELLAGDADAFGRFYARHEDFVLAVFLRRLGAGNAELAALVLAEIPRGGGGTVIRDATIVWRAANGTIIKR